MSVAGRPVDRLPHGRTGRRVSTLSFEQAELLWLNEYYDLATVGVTAGEFCELRSSLIHMTNLDSRKVHAEKRKGSYPCSPTRTEMFRRSSMA